MNILRTKQELLLALPFDFLLSFACQTKLVRQIWPNYTKKDLVHSLVRSLSEKHCVMLKDEFDQVQGYQSTLREILFELPTANDIKLNFVSAIRPKINDNGVIVQELPLRETRVDVAVFDTSSTAYELKGPRDTTHRLIRQLSTYSKVFDYVAVVSDGQDIGTLPKHVGVVEVGRHRGRMVFVIRKRPIMNRRIDPFAQLQLLHKDELQCLSKKVGNVSYDRARLIKAISRSVSAGDVNSYYKSVMVARELTKVKRRESFCGPVPMIQSRLYG